MSAKKLQGRFEHLIASLAVTQGREKYLKNQVNYLKKKLKQYSRWQYNPPENEIEDISNQLSIKGFWYGGSFDRGIHINKKFDIDDYIIYKEVEEVELNPKAFTGEILFTILYGDLKTIQKNEKCELSILKNLPQNHAIPVRLDFEGQRVYLDCIPAIELPDQYLLAPNGWNDVKKVNLKLEEQGLSKINEKSNGKATKLIWLIKFWNYRHQNPLKSYVIQRLVEEIFITHPINEWENAIKIFFSQALEILNKHLKNEIVLRDRVYTHKSILKDYSSKKIKKFQITLQKGNLQVINNEWNKIFGSF